jgi:hypothetical protein
MRGVEWASSMEWHHQWNKSASLQCPHRGSGELAGVIPMGSEHNRFQDYLKSIQKSKIKTDAYYSGLDGNSREYFGIIFSESPQGLYI